MLVDRRDTSFGGIGRRLRTTWTRILFACCAWGLLFGLPTASAQQLGDLKVGHWVEFKGELDADGRFVAASLEVLPPDDTHVLIGTVTAVDAPRSTFFVLNQEVRVSERTQWKDVSLAAVQGKRVKVEGHFRGTAKFSARQVSARGEGRDRIVGRVDTLELVEGRTIAKVMGYEVVVPAAAAFENKEPFTGVPLAPREEFEATTQARRESDDYIPGTFRLAEDFYFGVLLDWKSERDVDFDFDEARRADVGTSRLSVRAQFLWTPSENFSALFSPRYEIGWRSDQRFADQRTGNPGIQELWGNWRDVAGTGIDAQVGRQEFVDLREWLYKANLDAVRGIAHVAGLRVEASASTVGFDGDPRDEHSDNLMLYVSNDDEIRHLAAYVIDRRDRYSDVREYPIHFGARAVGAWLPYSKVWLEGSILRGYQGDTDLRGSAFDVGLSWSPPAIAPAYLIAGYAWGSGDDGSSTGVDESFRQTGLQRNNGKLGGVTSYRYYGELIDPELSNLSVLTLGVGTRFARRSSIDLVYHAYEQDEAAPFLRDANLKEDPDGVHTRLGHEIDLVVGTKAFEGFDFELVLGWFDPGRAFAKSDDAWMGSFQVRYRF